MLPFHEQTQEFQMGRLVGKIVLITGGSSGIGLASARRFVSEGAFVFITGRRQQELDNALAEIGHDVRALQGDVSKVDDLERIIATIREEKGHLDVVFANAGVAETAPLGSITEASFDRLFDINVKGTLFTVQRALPLMRVGGSIILNGSTAGSKGTPTFSVYNATKAAVRNLARSWALELKGTGIRVNVLSPGGTVTPGLAHVLTSGSSTPGDRAIDAVQRDAIFASFATQIPLGRIGEAAEIAAVAVFLASEDSSYMTGSEVFVDGGHAQV
jgi:NAD(P)-dependent dehydrogenase (short-subunit alcohol dehydrogenase family)